MSTGFDIVCFAYAPYKAKMSVSWFEYHPVANSGWSKLIGWMGEYLLVHWTKQTFSEQKKKFSKQYKSSLSGSNKYSRFLVILSNKIPWTVYRPKGFLTKPSFLASLYPNRQQHKFGDPFMTLFSGFEFWRMEID